MSRVREPSTASRRSWRRVVGCGVLLVAVLVDGGASSATVHRSGPLAALELFIHAAHGGAWTAHAAVGTSGSLGAVAPMVAASQSGDLIIAQRMSSGDVTVAQGTMSGTFRSVDLASFSAPPAQGRPAVWIGGGGQVAVWYRTAGGNLEVATKSSRKGAWTAVDVTALTGGASIGSDPTVQSGGSSFGVGYAVTSAGALSHFSATGPGGAWVQSDPTGGLTFPRLNGPVRVFRAPGMPQATVILGTTVAGDVLALSNELAGPVNAVGPWSAADLTQLGAPSAAGPLDAIGRNIPVATYGTPAGDVVALRLTSGLKGGFTTSDLTAATELQAAPGAVPSLVVGPQGPSVAVRTLMGDVTLTPLAGRPTSSDLSFQPRTAQLVGSDIAAASVGGATVLVASSDGPIAATPLERRIILKAASYDQGHRFFRTTPNGSYCNPFTAAYGRGSTSGCPRGYSAEEWCSDFAQYVWQSAGIQTRGITGWSATFAQWGAAHHRVQFGTRFAAQPGDAIVWGTRSPLYGTHVAIIVGVEGRYIDIVSGDSPGGFPGYGIGVWRSGPFLASPSTVNGYAVLSVVTP